MNRKYHFTSLAFDWFDSVEINSKTELYGDDLHSYIIEKLTLWLFNSSPSLKEKRRVMNTMTIDEILSSIEVTVTDCE